MDNNFVVPFWFLIIILIIVLNIKIVPQSYCYVIERMGVYHKTLNAGIHFILPMIDRVAKKICLKEQIIENQNELITKDKITVNVDTSIRYEIIDEKLYTYSIQNLSITVNDIIAVTLKNSINDMTLDTVFVSQNKIVNQLNYELTYVINNLGIKINCIEIKNITESN